MTIFHKHLDKPLQCVSKNDTGLTHYNCDIHKGILIILADMLPRKYLVKQETQKLCLFTYMLFAVCSTDNTKHIKISPGHC